jgi:putative ABC transport system permease protein
VVSETPAPRARSSRLKTSARFLFRSLGLRGPSFLLAFLAITVGATVTATMLNLKSDLAAKMSKELRRYGPNLLLTPRAEGAATLDESEVRRVAGAAPLLLAPGSVETAPDALPGAGSATIVGCDFEALRRLNPSWGVAGTWPAAGAAPAPDAAQPCVIGAALAARAGVNVGETATVSVGSIDIALRITGIVSTGEAEDEELFVSLPVLQRATGRTGRVSLAALAVDGGEEAVIRAGGVAEAMVRDAVARPLRPIAAAQGAVLGKLDRMMALLTTLILLLTGLCLVTTLMAMVVEREEEIGILRSMGARDGEILKMFSAEVGLLGLFGAFAGLGLGALAARQIGWHLFGAAITARAGIVPAVVAVSLGLCLVAVLLPLRRALAVQPATALRGE